MLHIKSTSEAKCLLAENLLSKSYSLKGEEKKAILERAERLVKDSIQNVKPAKATMYFTLADILEDQSSFGEAEINFGKAFELAQKEKDINVQTNSLRGLIRSTYALGKVASGEAFFNKLVESGQANGWDWQAQGRRLDNINEYSKAGYSYRNAAVLDAGWRNWCEAAGSYFLTAERDPVLECARKCIAHGTGKKDYEEIISRAHYQIASILNERGVYPDALNHAREATALDSSSAWAFHALGEALAGLMRFQEAIKASKQAIRLSDGKYAIMHFTLASCYFETENWQLAKQSFEQAAQLSPKDDIAAYNVAICLARLGYYRDAANWYEEVLRRNPNHQNRSDIINRINILRR